MGEVIDFPGNDPVEPEGGDTVSDPGRGALGIPGLSEDQEKAVRIAMDGMSFVMIGIRPTATGADFFTAVHGRRSELADAAPHLDGVIHRAFVRLGLIED